MIFTPLQLSDQLPLTCSRKGTCCFGNQIRVNPFEIAQLAATKQISVTQFMEEFTEWNGIQLKFAGIENGLKQQSCSLYHPDFGCTVHEGRPLACRLFPLGRSIQEEVVTYVHRDSIFPCFKGCEEVKKLPFLTVENYLQGQATTAFEYAQDAYLEMVQNIADIALSLLLDTALISSKEHQTLLAWKKISEKSMEDLAKSIRELWINRLLNPELNAQDVAFTSKHNDLFIQQAQEEINAFQTVDQVFHFSCLMFRIALFLSKSIGADPKEMGQLWINIARENGAKY